MLPQNGSDSWRWHAVELFPIPAKDKHQLLAEMSKGEFDLLSVMIKAVQAR